MPASPFTCADHTILSDDYAERQDQADELRQAGYQQRRCGTCGRWAIWVDARHRPIRSFEELLAEWNAPIEYDGDIDEALDMVAAWLAARLDLGRYEDSWPHLVAEPGRIQARRIQAEAEAWLLERGLIHPTD